MTVNQIGRQCGQSIVAVIRPAIFDRHVPALGIAGLFQTLMESRQKRRIQAGRCAMKEPNHGHRRLLRARSERPRGRRAAEQRDELAPFHSITSSARPNTASGNERPSNFAVLRLMTSSTFVDWETGSSAGFSPLRIFAA